MENTISKRLQNTFLVHAIVSAILGLVLYVIPGRMLVLLGWVADESKVDPVITRVLGAAMLALAFAGYFGSRAKQYQEVSILVPFELVFCVLALVAFLYRIVSFGLASIPVIGWVLIIILLGFGVVWGMLLRRR